VHTTKKEAISPIEGGTVAKLKYLLGILFQEKWKNTSGGFLHVLCSEQQWDADFEEEVLGKT
jgi:hypothetical protein